VKFVPLVWAALWRNRTETALTLLALTVAFTLFGTMVALNAAYERAIYSSAPNRLFMFCRFDCPDRLPLAYRDEIARIPGVVAIGAMAVLQGYHPDPSKKLGVQFVDENYKAAWPELTIDDAQWKTLLANRTGVYFTRSAAIRCRCLEGTRHVPPDRCDVHELERAHVLRAHT
jgi:putative ABC transport system permease protein